MWVLVLLLLKIYIPDFGASEEQVQYDGIDVILLGPCRDHRVEKKLYGLGDENIKEDLAGIIVRADCNPPEVILWFKGDKRAYWVNPFVALQGLAEDVRRMSVPIHLKSRFTDVLDTAFRRDQLAPDADTLPPPPRDSPSLQDSIKLP
ncbi:envelope glycoprotein L [Felid alphaherpesvirus 1]|nr:envelope glycoprotein L [Felid alphaherpesvirus 1]